MSAYLSTEKVVISVRVTAPLPWKLTLKEWDWKLFRSHEKFGAESTEIGKLASFTSFGVL
jgi:hypothetical protein